MSNWWSMHHSVWSYNKYEVSDFCNVDLTKVFIVVMALYLLYRIHIKMQWNPSEFALSWNQQHDRGTNSPVMYEACFADLELDYGIWVTLFFLYNIPPDLSIQGHSLRSNWAPDGDGCPECHGCHISRQRSPSVKSTCCRGAFRTKISCRDCILDIISAQEIPRSLPYYCYYICVPVSLLS